MTQRFCIVTTYVPDTNHPIKQLNHHQRRPPTAYHDYFQPSARLSTLLSPINIMRAWQAEELEVLITWMEENYGRSRGKPAGWINRVKEDVFSGGGGFRRVAV